MLIEKKIIKEMVTDIEKMGFSRRKIRNEIITVKKIKRTDIMTDKLAIFSSPVVESKEDLEDYMKRAHERIISLPENIKNICATITFKKPQPESKIEEIRFRYYLNVYGVKLNGSHGFKTVTRYPIDKTYLRHVSECIIANYNRNRGLSKYEPEESQIMEKLYPKKFIEIFKINQGIFALYCLGMSSNIISCIEEGEIYLVDIGPIEVRDYLLQIETYLPKDLVIIPPSDMASYVTEFLV